MNAGHDNKAESIDLSNLQLQFISEQLTCAMCETELEIHHQVDLAALKVREEAHCPSCGIRVRSCHHLLN